MVIPDYLYGYLSLTHKIGGHMTFFNEIFENFKKAIGMTGFLIKIILPVSLAIKLLQELGLISWVAKGLAPVMNLVGLSGELGIIWITSMLTNIYGGLITLFNMSSYRSFTAGEITILATMILIAHSMIVETKVLSKAGGKGTKLVFTRVISAVVLGALMNLVFKFYGLYEETVSFSWVPKSNQNTYLQWFLAQLKNYTNIFAIIFILLVVMDLLKKIGLLQKINTGLKPVLNLLGIGKEASTINLVALTLGISYGGALLLEEGRSGRLTKEDLEYSTTFMALCHAIVEDTLLMVGIGASIWGVLVVRFLYAFFFVYILNKVRCSFGRKKQEAY